MFTDSLVPLCLTFLGYYLIAVLALYAPDNKLRRFAVLFVTLSFAGWAVVEFEEGPLAPELRVYALGFMGIVLSLIMRSIELTVSAPQSLRRIKETRDRASVDASSDVPPLDFKSAAIDAADLFANLRGHGWSFSKGLVLPAETRPQRTTPFVLRSFALLSFQFTLFDIMLHVVRYLRPAIGSPTGASLFDPSLPLVSRYTESTILTMFVGLSAYLLISSIYLTGTLVGVLVLRQSTRQWPQLFDAPWRATSITDFWNRRWHQFFRRTFIVLGAKPILLVLNFGVLGRAGAVLGAFTVSGVFHDWATWGMGCELATREIVGFFVMNGVGVLLEEAWRWSKPGREVRGWVGWLWTAIWIIGWAHMLVEAWLTRGLAGVRLVPDHWSIGYALVQRFSDTT